MAPGIPNRQMTLLSTLPSRQCESPDANVVPISAKWTAALADTGVAPNKTNSVVEVMPKAMPNVPSTN
jgi:hypothetical protein